MKRHKSPPPSIVSLSAIFFALIIVLTATSAYADKTRDAQAEAQRRVVDAISEKIGEGLGEVIRLNDLNDTEKYLTTAYLVAFDNMNNSQKSFDAKFLNLITMSAIEMECEHINNPHFKKTILYKTSYHSTYFEPEQVKERLARITEFYRTMGITDPTLISTEPFAKFLDGRILQPAVDIIVRRQDQITRMQDQTIAPFVDPKAQDQIMTNVEKMQKKMIENGPDAIIQTTTIPP
jgi:hypothetical protein